MPADQASSQDATSRKFTAKNVAIPVALVTLAALSSAASQQSLAPVYGSIPSSSFHQSLLTTTALLAFATRYQFKQWPLSDMRWYLPVLVYWIPTIQFLLLQYSSSLGPHFGPPLTEGLTFVPVLFASCYAATEAIEDFDLTARFGRILGELLPPAIAYAHLSITAKAFKSLLPRFFQVTDLVTPVNLSLLVGSIYAFMTPSRLCFLAIPAIIHTARVNPHYSSPHTTFLMNETLHTQNWSLIDRQWSNTGYISVLENLDLQYRVMRCDHSLLGGEWTLTEQRQIKENWAVNEPIYAVFEMLEAVRLMDVRTVQDVEANALVIGLGIGTAPKALLAHGINTTIIELDPIVHEFATLYFDLPTNHTAVLQDAISWVHGNIRWNTDATSLAGLDSSLHEQQPQVTQDDLEEHPKHYDYVIHDVFTGGAEPLPLFTKEFLEDLRSLLTPNGVIAINYAGELGARLSDLVLNTIDVVFDGQCKIFRDNPPLPKESGSTTELDTDFLNMVIFCRNSPGDIFFRPPTEADFLGSHSRRHYLQPRPELEIPFPFRPVLDGDVEECGYRLMKVLWRSEVHNWQGEQTESAVRHWEIMRKVVPAAVWELW